MTKLFCILISSLNLGTAAHLGSRAQVQGYLIWVLGSNYRQIFSLEKVELQVRQFLCLFLCLLLVSRLLG